jgi:hypothetical protein
MILQNILMDLILFMFVAELCGRKHLNASLPLLINICKNIDTNPYACITAIIKLTQKVINSFILPSFYSKSQT